MIGNSGITHCPQIDGIEWPQLLESIFRHHAAGCEIGLAAPVEMLPRKRQIKPASRRFEYANALGNHFPPNAIAFDHRYSIVLQSPSQSKILLSTIIY